MPFFLSGSITALIGSAYLMAMSLVSGSPHRPPSSLSYPMELRAYGSTWQRSPIADLLRLLMFREPLHFTVLTVCRDRP
ncbi:hypothetical protein DAEQUDRAFT_731101 [Daedalea quercina L-15889]|uniref:Uncharacterized protein n=1 Tax=Daedalea quercina L-15889 TaxID=1314783 RepID=A0A165MH77_9APHY|nr:hypothetical protein DAEQUDRAFT_731101 [Daedalea quercina L-15889]